MLNRYLLSQWINEKVLHGQLSGHALHMDVFRFLFSHDNTQLFNPLISQAVRFGWEGVQRTILFALRYHAHICHGEVGQLCNGPDVTCFPALNFGRNSSLLI